MDPALDKNEPEFGVLVLPVPLKMLPNGNSLLDQKVQVLWDFRGQAYTPKKNLARQCTNPSINTQE